MRIFKWVVFTHLYKWFSVCVLLSISVSDKDCQFLTFDGFTGSRLLPLFVIVEVYYFTKLSLLFIDRC